MSENYEQTKSPEFWALLVMEEAAEVQQAVSKLLRYGPMSTRDNIGDLEKEIKDLLYCLYMLEHHEWIHVATKQEVIEYEQTKRQRNFKSVLNAA